MGRKTPGGPKSQLATWLATKNPARQWATRKPGVPHPGSLVRCPKLLARSRPIPALNEPVLVLRLRRPRYGSQDDRTHALGATVALFSTSGSSPRGAGGAARFGAPGGCSWSEFRRLGEPSRAPYLSPSNPHHRHRQRIARIRDQTPEAKPVAGTNISDGWFFPLGSRAQRTGDPGGLSTATIALAIPENAHASTIL